MDNDNDDLDAMFNDGGEGGAPAAAPPADPPGDTSTSTPPAPAAPEKPGEQPPAPEDGKPTPTGEQPPTPSEKPGQEPQQPKPGEQPQPPTGEQPPTEEAPKPLTADDVRAVITDVRDQERLSSRGVQEMEQQVLQAYYPQGLSNTLVDEKSGREIKTPQDVVELSGGEMSTEEAAQWLMNEQYKLDQQVNAIKGSARELAETNFNFRQGATRVLEKYQPIFDKYPQLQQKIYRNYMKQVKMDNEKDLILSAPDIEDYYADIMEPYVLAFGYSQKEAQGQPPAATGGAQPGKPAIPESKQTAADRMDEGGDGGTGAGDDVDPNDPDASLNKLFGE